MRDSDAGEFFLEFCDLTADRLFVFAKTGGELGFVDGPEVGEEHPADDRGPDLQAVGVLHAVLPNPLDQAGDDLAGPRDFIV